MSRKPRDKTFELEGHGSSVDLKFTTFEYPYNKGADGRIRLKSNRKFEGARWGNDGKPETTVEIKQDTLIWGLTYNKLKELEKWAGQAAEWVKKTQTAQGWFRPDE